MSKHKKSALAVLLLVAVATVVYVRYKKEHQEYDSNSYSAVFLSNNQVYFGHIQDISGKNLILTGVYYLKASADVNNADSQNGQTDAKLSLIKLGDELHGPTDRMVINRDNVLFFEQMKDTSEIMKAIASNENKGQTQK